MHLKRLMVAVIVLPLLYLYITKLSAIYFLFLLAIVSAIALHEFYSMYNVRGLLRYLGILGGTLILLAVSHQPSAISHQQSDLFVILFIIVACIRLISRRNPEASLYDMASVVIGVLYIPGLTGYQMHLRRYGAEWIIFLYGCVWASDSLAYYIGKGIGKRKLYEEISPNKTVAGAVGSIMGGAIGAVILKYVFISSISFVWATILGTIIGGVTIIGDLVESMFKRDAGVKDSSNIVPGHGGMLDKLDGVLFAGPVLYWVAKWFRLIG